MSSDYFDRKIQEIYKNYYPHGRIPDFDEKLFGVGLTNQKVWDAYYKLLGENEEREDDDVVYLVSLMKTMEDVGLPLNVVLKVFQILLERNHYYNLLIFFEEKIREVNPSVSFSQFQSILEKIQQHPNGSSILLEMHFRDGSSTSWNISITNPCDIFNFFLSEDFLKFITGKYPTHVKLSIFDPGIR